MSHDPVVDGQQEDASVETSDPGNGVAEEHITPKQEKEILKKIDNENKPLEEGDTWYILSLRWWKQWKRHVFYDDYFEPNESDYTSPRPGPIDNEELVEGEENILRRNMQENIDFVVFPVEMWRKLHGWYGGGPALPRKVITYGYARNLTVELKLLKLQIMRSSKLDESFWMHISKSASVESLKLAACQQFQLDPAQVRVWDYHSGQRLKCLEEEKDRLDEAQIIDEQKVLIEEKDAEGKWPEVEQPKATSSYYYNDAYSRRESSSQKGVTGLSNLGNTCFMNSSLQCLSNTAPLTLYFLGNMHKRDINVDNPMGCGGRLAEEYGNLVAEMWSGRYGTAAPRDFKSRLERFAPQFAGYQQHDSQELLAFLLDGLHEDLNRVRKKPYVESKESDGRPDADVAAEAWTNHLSRNNSIIVDWCQGQLKSTLVCPQCSRVSVTFDPFMYLSLPLPMSTTRIVPVTVFKRDGAQAPTRYGVVVPKFGTVGDLKQALSDLCGVPKDALVITDVYASKFFKEYKDKEMVDAITERDVIFAYEILVPQADTDMSTWNIAYCPVIQRREETVSTYYYGSTTKISNFSSPFILSVSTEATYEDLYNEILGHVRRYIRLPATTQAAEEPEHNHGRKDSVSGYESDNEDDETSAAHKHPHRQGDGSSGAQLPPRLFQIKRVTNYDEKPLPDDGQPLGLDDRQGLTIDWYTDLIREVYDEERDKDVVVHPSARAQEDSEETAVTLEHCLELFTTTERLGMDDLWYCNKCKDHMQATKKFDLWTLPNILVVHLKRFSYRNKYWREKLETLVQFPTRGLDLSRYIKSEQAPGALPPVYDLYAVSNHYGSLGGGHYTAYGMNKDNGKWYKFDDSWTAEVAETDVVTSSAYVLFYKRRGCENLPLPPFVPYPEGDDNNGEPHSPATTRAAM
eukprot:TRINITY_DN3249_c0_g1_i3.p1 TRINITY_DN3249_c0_g1~~TRINITY_DN3249_c0_g1_i3.p1  ORF type:complete len:929 (-),score=274.41 TRINITY_DN3249_c0_g1_i3:1131-3872(-)